MEDSCSAGEVLEDWAFITLVVTRLYVPPPTPGGCESNVAGTSAAPASALLAALAAFGITMRRR